MERNRDFSKIALAALACLSCRETQFSWRSMKGPTPVKCSDCISTVGHHHALSLVCTYETPVEEMRV